MSLEPVVVVPGEAHELAAAVVGQQHPHLLEGLPDGPHPVAESLAGGQVAAQPGARLAGGEPAAEPLHVVRNIVGLDLAAGEDVVARRELAAPVTLDQQDLGRAGGPVAHEDQGGRGRRSCRWAHGDRSSKPSAF
jgi:hypothetical protein